MSETWLPAYGLEDRFEVSDRGRIRNVKTGHTLIPSLVCGYFRIRIRIPGSKKKLNVRVHRLVASTFIRPPVGNECVNHRDFDRSNNELSNLEWVTPQENTQHAVEGERFPKKLTNEALEEIRAMAVRGERKSVIASRFGVGQSAIHSILTGRTHQGRGCLAVGPSKVARHLHSIGFHRALTVCQDTACEFANVLHFKTLSAGQSGLVSAADRHSNTERKFVNVGKGVGEIRNV